VPLGSFPDQSLAEGHFRPLVVAAIQQSIPGNGRVRVRRVDRKRFPLEKRVVVSKAVVPPNHPEAETDLIDNHWIELPNIEIDRAALC